MLYLIGIGLGNELDITVNGLEIVRRCSRIYLENYTSLLDTTIKKLEQLYGMEVILAEREFVEDGKEIIEFAKKKDVALLVIGDALSATTHVSLLMQAKESGVDAKVIHNASILNVVSDTGLSLYKFGKTASIPFDNENVETPYNILKENLSISAHTLFLLDLRPKENTFMTVNEAIEYLFRAEVKNKLKIFNKDTYVVACCKLGSDNAVIKYGKAADLVLEEFNLFPQCLIVPSKLHFVEDDFLRTFSL